jgi:hypothetical protein
VRTGERIWVTQDFSHEVEEVSSSDAQRRIANQFQRLRKQAVGSPLPLISRPSLDAMACKMARNDRLNADVIHDIPKANHLAVFTVTDLEKGVPALENLKSVTASGFSVGICYAASPTYTVPVYWGIVATYF